MRLLRYSLNHESYHYKFTNRARCRPSTVAVRPIDYRRLCNWRRTNRGIGNRGKRSARCFLLHVYSQFVRIDTSSNFGRRKDITRRGQCGNFAADTNNRWPQRSNFRAGCRYQLNRRVVWCPRCRRFVYCFHVCVPKKNGPPFSSGPCNCVTV